MLLVCLGCCVLLLPGLVFLRRCLLQGRRIGVVVVRGVGIVVVLLLPFVVVGVVGVLRWVFCVLSLLPS